MQGFWSKTNVENKEIFMSIPLSPTGNNPFGLGEEWHLVRARGMTRTRLWQRLLISYHQHTGIWFYPQNQRNNAMHAGKQKKYKTSTICEPSSTHCDDCCEFLLLWPTIRCSILGNYWTKVQQKIHQTLQTCMQCLEKQKRSESLKSLRLLLDVDGEKPFLSSYTQCYYNVWLITSWWLHNSV